MKVTPSQAMSKSKEKSLSNAQNAHARGTFSTNFWKPRVKATTLPNE